MIDQYSNYQELRSAHDEDVDYRIQAVFRSEALIVLAIHAGGIEMGTSELARAIAGQDFSLYLFEGLTGNNLVYHITSTKFDEPRGLELLPRHTTALSLHGFKAAPTDPLIYLGGRDHDLIRRLLEAFRDAGYPAQIHSGKYAATDPGNICNRTRSGKGVQLELSDKLRSRFFEDYLRRRGREHKTTEFERFVAVVRGVLQNQ